MVKIAKGVYLPTSFAKPKKQAGKIMKQLQSSRFCGRSTLQSSGTIRNYEQALTTVAKYIQCQTGEALRDINVNQAIEYLSDRGAQIGQKTLDMERQALQLMMQVVTFKLRNNEKLPVIKSEHQQILKSRSYTREQVTVIINHQSELHGLATQIAYASGLRAHELITIQPITHQPTDPRPSLPIKFKGREGIPYSVIGKGGLIREVRIPEYLAVKLEDLRRTKPIKIIDRKIFYQQFYHIGGGQKWSSSFSAASNRALDRSNGAHGLRHSYAQDRMCELGLAGYERELSLEVVSQEMGHFRPSITEIYLR